MNDEANPIDSLSRCTLLFLIGSGLAWLVVAGALALVASLQQVAPGFLSGCELLTYGRMTALAETAFIYGWLANAGLALGLWILGRLGGQPLRALNWAWWGAVFWNLGVTGALVGVATGDRTGFDFLELPRYVQPILLFSYGAIAIPGILAWGGRRRSAAYAAQWYAVAALFLFPWFFSAAQVMLFWAPVRGVEQAVLSGWYAQAAWTLWIAPLALATAYYVLPKISGKTVRAYEFAALGFWVLLLVGAWTGGRHLVGGPVPAWIPAVGVVATALLVFHYLIVTVNLGAAFGLKGIAPRFISFGVLAYLLSAAADFLTAFHGVAASIQFTHMESAQRELALYGAASMMLFGGLYYAVPLITGSAWKCATSARGHLALMLTGVTLLIVCLAGAGLTQGGALLDPKVAFEAIAGLTRPWMMGACVAEGLLLLGNILLLLNFAGTACSECCERAAAFGRQQLAGGRAS